MPRYTRPTRRASLIAEIPHDERPRERLLRKGPQSLSDAELVAILLRNGRPGASVLEVAREVLAEAGGLTGLSTACTKSLRRRGVGEVKIATLLAAVEIACRMAGAAVPDREVLSKPEVVARYVYLRYGRFAREVMGALRSPVGWGRRGRRWGSSWSTTWWWPRAGAGSRSRTGVGGDGWWGCRASTPGPWVATAIYGMVEGVLADEIRPAVEHLEWAARVTGEELRVRWEKNRRLWERFQGRL